MMVYCWKLKSICFALSRVEELQESLHIKRGVYAAHPHLGAVPSGFVDGSTKNLSSEVARSPFEQFSTPDRREVARCADAEASRQAFHFPCCPSDSRKHGAFEQLGADRMGWLARIHLHVAPARRSRFQMQRRRVVVLPLQAHFMVD
jgi:hypothetical protein